MSGEYQSKAKFILSYWDSLLSVSMNVPMVEDLVKLLNDTPNLPHHLHCLKEKLENRLEGFWGSTQERESA